MAYVLGGEPGLGDYLRRVLEQGAFFTGEFAAVLDAFSDARNPAAHGSALDRETVVTWRNRLLGVGAESVMGKLATVRMRQA